MKQNPASVNAGRPQYCQLSTTPFYNANNILMFFGGGDRGLIAESVIRALREYEPVVHVHGEPGSGKTMMSLVISDRIKNHFHSIRYDLPEITATKLMRHLLIELTPQYSELISAEQAQTGVKWPVIERAIDHLKQHLRVLNQRTYLKPYVILIDSNQSLDAESLRVIERLGSCEIDDDVMLQCVVFHQAASDAQRYADVSEAPYSSENHFWLRRLTFGETSEYLRHHMMLFDFNRRDLFTQEMAYFVTERSDGVFKSIHELAQGAFTLADLEASDKLSMSHLITADLATATKTPVNTGFATNYHAATYTLLGCGAVACSMAMVYLFQSL